MKVAGIVTITNPDYRQDPARECIRQALEICDDVIVIYGREEDSVMLNDLTMHIGSQIYTHYLKWPQPEWTLDELPKHLNKGLEIARSLGADWCIKFDADYFIHENHRHEVRNHLEQAMTTGAMLMSLNKFQLSTPTRGRQKGDLPICIRLCYPIWYGQNRDHYTDLCQPIIWDGKETISADDDPNKAIPVGDAVPKGKIGRTGAWLWNYGYMFKTYERSLELLYYFDLAHAAWWGRGWFQTRPGDISPENAMAHFIEMSKGRMRADTKTVKIEDHPKHIQQKLRDLKPEQFGFNFWGLINLDNQNDK